MARPGYIKARNDLYDAERSVQSAEIELAALRASEITEGWTPESFNAIKDDLIADKLKWLEKYRTELVDAQKAFEQFGPSKSEKRTYYSYHRQVHLSFDKELADVIAEEESRGVSLAEMVRSALAARLLPK